MARQLVTIARAAIAVGIAVTALTALALTALALAFGAWTAGMLWTVLALTLAFAMATRGLAAVA